MHTYLRQRFKCIFWFALVRSLLVSCHSAPAGNAPHWEWIDPETLLPK
jgi:hypothetical protein